MEENQKFSMKELQEFEELEILGGGDTDDVIQIGCSNDSIGCACDVDAGCSNDNTGCACDVTEPEDPPVKGEGEN